MKVKTKSYLISILSSFVSAALPLIALLGLGASVAINEAVVSDQTAFIESTSVNYLVYGLSEEQQQEYKNLDSVDYVRSYYLYETNFAINGNDYQNNLSIFASSDMEGTPFNDSRILSKTEKKVNPVYLDYLFANSYGLSLGDTFEIKLGSERVDASVAGIYKTNYLEDSRVFLYYEDFKDLIDNMFDDFKTNYSYIHTNDAVSFDAYLKENYIPKAFMKTRDDFDSEIDYQIYLKNYTDQDYYNSENVKPVNVKADAERSQKAGLGKVACVLISGLGVLVAELLFAFIYRRNLKVASLSTNDFKSFSVPLIVGFCLSLVLGIAGFLVVCPRYCSQIAKMNFASTFQSLAPVLIAFCAAALVGFVLKLIFTRTALSSGKHEDKEGEKKKN